MHGIEYEDMFAPTVRYDTLRTFLAIVATKDRRIVPERRDLHGGATWRKNRTGQSITDPTQLIVGSIERDMSEDAQPQRQ